MASPSGSNGEMAIISNSWEDCISWRSSFSESSTAFLPTVQWRSFKDMGIFQYLEQVIKTQPFVVFTGTGVSKISRKRAEKSQQGR